MGDIEIIDLREKFFKISNEIFKADLDIYAIGVYTALCRFANNETTESFPSLTTLCEMLKISRPKLIKTIKELESKSIILKKQGNSNYSNRYYLMTIPSKSHKVVNEINQGSKPHLPPSKPHLPRVVNDVYPIKTNIKILNKKTNIKKAIDIPDSLNTPLFFKTWDIWIQYKKERREKMPDTTINFQIRKLSKTPNDAVEMINQSIENGWKGLFEIKGTNKKQSVSDIYQDQIKRIKAGTLK